MLSIILTEMIEQYVVPQLQQDGILDTIIYQQDGAPSHSVIIVRGQLNHLFNDRWCGHDGPIPWNVRVLHNLPPNTDQITRRHLKLIYQLVQSSRLSPSINLR